MITMYQLLLRLIISQLCGLIMTQPKQCEVIILSISRTASTDL